MKWKQLKWYEYSLSEMDTACGIDTASKIDTPCGMATVQLKWNGHSLSGMDTA